MARHLKAERNCGDFFPLWQRKYDGGGNLIKVKRSKNKNLTSFTSESIIKEKKHLKPEIKIVK